MTTTQSEQTFVRASADEADPVGRIGADHGFWNETWSEWHGGHADEAAARAACREYASRL